MPDNVLKFAIIGCGKIARRHAEQIHTQGRLIAVCDILKDKAHELAREYSCQFFYSINELLANCKNLDVAVICTPNGLHAEQTILCLQKGYHVLCEKPMAIKSADCLKMIAASEQNEKKLFVVKQNRFNPPVVAVKNAINEGKLGKIFSIQMNCFWNRNEGYYKNSWRGTKELDGGVLFTQFSHFIDLLYWIAGDVDEVHAYTENYLHQNIIEFEDTGVVILKFKNEITGSIHFTVNSYKKNMEGSLTVFGEKGTVKIGGEYLNTLEYQKIENFTIENLPESNVANNYGSYQGSMSNHNKVYEKVIEVIHANTDIQTNAYDSMKTVEIIEKIYAAAARNKT